MDRVEQNIEREDKKKKENVIGLPESLLCRLEVKEDESTVLYNQSIV